ncbi:MAG: Lrp/AsnC family transcriptional regulator [Chloroflexi bacterium]|nr:Lrp/AsnC family transcriptional regulator [Chloroflexota bacterium]
MSHSKGNELDQLDLMILREMEIDGRQPVSDLAKKLGTSRANASRKLKRLIDTKITSIVAFTNPLVLGYRTVAMIGIQVSPREIHETADRLSALPNVHLVIIAAGRHDIIIWTMFQTPADLSIFLGRELGGITGITSTETMIVLEMKKQSFDFLAASGVGCNEDQPSKHTPPVPPVTEELIQGIDQYDLMILKEMENDARQSISDLAKKLGTSRAYASTKLQKLLNQQLIKIVAFTNPLTLGYHVFALIGIKVSPNEIDAAAEMLSELAVVHTVAKVAGQHDIVIQTMFQNPIDLSTFLMGELSRIPGITSTETMIALELKKMSFMYLVSSHLAANGNQIKS